MTQQPDWAKEFDRFIESLPSRVAATPRVTLKDFIRDLLARTERVAREEGMNMAVDYIVEHSAQNPRWEHMLDVNKAVLEEARTLPTKPTV